MKNSSSGDSKFRPMRKRSFGSAVKPRFEARDEGENQRDNREEYAPRRSAYNDNRRSNERSSSYGRSSYRSDRSNGYARNYNEERGEDYERPRSYGRSQSYERSERSDREYTPRRDSRSFDRPYTPRRREDGRPARQSRVGNPTTEITSIDVARAFNVATTVWKLFSGIMEKRQPLDKLLSGFFRENKKYGSKDRRLISETIYALCRHWGNVKQNAPEPEAPMIWRCLSRSGLEGNGLWFYPLLESWMLDELTELDPIVFKIWSQHVARALSQTQSKDNKKFDVKTLVDELKNISDEDIEKYLTSAFPTWFASIVPENINITQLMECYQTRPPLWLRFQHDETETLALLAQDEIYPEKSNLLSMAYCLKNTRVNLFNSAAFRKGWIEVQDISSQCIGHVCNPAPKSRWLDYCAGAGGKTLQLAAMLNNKGTVIAVDKRNWKLDDLKKRARRAQLCNIQTRDTEGEFPKLPKESFDGVLVDAPCSCTGTWRRNPDARWTTQTSEIQELADLQLAILSRAQKTVKPQGVLVYATCSVTVPENEGVVEKFLQQFPDFEVEPFAHPLTGETCENGYARIQPWEGDGDAMFVARFRKKQA